VSEESQVSEQIQQLEDARLAAMVGKDVETLDRLLDDKLIYMHSTGVADTKASYLEGLRTGVWDYQSVDRADQRIQVDGACSERSTVVRWPSGCASPMAGACLPCSPARFLTRVERA
jgi:hypothetical protein